VNESIFFDVDGVSPVQVFLCGTSLFSIDSVQVGGYSKWNITKVVDSQ